MSEYKHDVASLEAMRAYRDAAIADGWAHEPIYEIEPEESAVKLTRDGYQISMLLRDYEAPCWKDMPWVKGKYRYCVSISIWGPDGLFVNPPETYNWAAIQAGASTCEYCGKSPTQTRRVGFAGRSCEACLPEQRRIQETPGWCD